MSALDIGMSPAASWLLLLGLWGAAMLLTRWLLRVDDRDYSLEVGEPASNVTVLAPVVDCHPDCALAADLHLIRVLPETEHSR